jgi:hypothetical protein
LNFLKSRLVNPRIQPLSAECRAGFSFSFDQTYPSAANPPTKERDNVTSKRLKLEWRLVKGTIITGVGFPVAVTVKEFLELASGLGEPAEVLSRNDSD